MKCFLGHDLNTEPLDHTIAKLFDRNRHIFIRLSQMSEKSDW
jgi:hypothetical protein